MPKGKNMSSKPETLYGFTRICAYCNWCRKCCTLGVTTPKNTVIYLPVINNTIVYDYATPNQFMDTICFTPNNAIAMAREIATLCYIHKSQRHK